MNMASSATRVRVGIVWLSAAVMVSNLEDGGTTQTGLRNESLAQSFRTGSVAATLESVRVPDAIPADV